MVKRTPKYSKGCKVVAKFKEGGGVGGIGGGSGVDGSGNRGNGGYGGGNSGNQGGGGMGGGGKGGVGGTGVHTGVNTGVNANNRPKPSAPSIGRPRPTGALPPKPSAPKPTPKPINIKTPPGTGPGNYWGGGGLWNNISRPSSPPSNGRGRSTEKGNGK